MTPFTYVCPTDLKEAVRLLADSGTPTKLLAGGQTLLLALKERTQRPARVLSLSSLKELSGVRELSDGRLDIGATTTYATLARFKFVGWHREVAAVAGNLADRSVRNLGTIGGAVCHAEPRYDMPTLLTAAGAQMHLVSAAGERTLGAAEFFNVGGGTHMSAAEILLRISLPGVTALDALAFEKFRFRVFDAAIVSVACALKLASNGTVATARIVVGAVAKAPLTAVATAAALQGMRPAELHPEEVAAKVAAELAPFNQSQNLRQRYQSELVISLTAKAIASALASTRGA